MKPNSVDSCKVYLDEQEDRIFLEGAVMFSNVANIRAAGADLIDTLVKVSIDLSKVTQADSSALALLLAWVRDANVQHKTIQYYNLPQKMLDLGRFNGLDVVLPIFKK